MKKIILVAGGTGGHINAAIALGDYFKSKNWDVTYLSGVRELDYKLFKNQKVIHLPSQALRYKNPFKIIKSLIKNLQSFLIAFNLIRKQKVDSVLGAGGYVCGPVLLAAFLLKRKTFILEQNSVLGLTNKILMKIVDKVFYHFPETQGVKASVKNINVGNPTRTFKIIRQEKNNLVKNVLVFGGSLGATEIIDLIDKIKNINEVKRNFKFVLQTGLTNKTNFSEDENIEIKSYIDDMGYFYNWADIIISRAGASTISELRVVGKPVFLIPYKFATDNHQEINAISFKNENLMPVEIYNRKMTIDENITKLISFLNSNHSQKQTYNYEDKSCQKIFKEISNESVEL